uniref:Uncharacterized protein n=1 Tax=Lates calcarifer TaxID=8187 RepID=A0A4W6EHT0_LATCA
MTPNSHGSVTTVSPVAVSQASPKISTHSLTLSPAALNCGPAIEAEALSLPKVPTFLSVPKTSYPNPTPVISMQAPTSPSPLSSTNRPPVFEARKSLSSLLETQMSLAASKPKSRSTYYGLTPAEYVAYGGIRSVGSHHSPVPFRVDERSSNKAQSEVAVDVPHISKSEATKQPNGHQDLPPSMELSAAHSLEPLSSPKDSEHPAERIVTCSKDVFEESRSEAHSIGIQSLKTSSMDTIKPEFPLGLAQKTMQQSTSDVPTPKASYSEAPIPMPKAGEVHTQSAALLSVEATLNTTPCLTDSSGLLSSSSPLVKVDSDTGTQYSAKGIDARENLEKTLTKEESKVTNAKQQSGLIEIAPVQPYQTAGSPSKANGFSVQFTAKPSHKNLVVHPLSTDLDPKFSGSAIINGSFNTGIQQATKLVSETPLHSKVATETILPKQREEVNQQIKVSSEVILPSKTNVVNILPAMAANIGYSILTNISTEPQFSNMFSKEPLDTNSGSMLPHEPVTASICSAQSSICTVSAAEQSTKFTQQVRAETLIYSPSQTAENKIHFPGASLSLISSQAPTVLNPSPVNTTPLSKPTTDTKLPGPSVIATKLPSFSDIKFPAETDASNVPTKETQKPNKNGENVFVNTPSSIGSSSQIKVVQGANFYINSSRPIVEITQTTETTLNIPAKDAILSNQANIEDKRPISINGKTNRLGTSTKVDTTQYPQLTNGRVGLETGNIQAEHFPNIPIRAENIKTKIASSLSKGNVALTTPSSETNLYNKPCAGTVSQSPGQPGGVEAVLPAAKSAQSNKSSLDSSGHSIPTIEIKVNNRLHTETILPMITDPTVSSKPTLNTVQVSRPTVPSSPTMGHVTPKSPQLRSESSATKQPTDVIPVSGSITQSRVYAKADSKQFANLATEERSSVTSAPQITNKTAIKEQSPFIQPITEKKSLASHTTKTKHSVTSCTEMTTSISTGYNTANISNINVEQQTITMPGHIKLPEDNVQTPALIASSQTGVKPFWQSLTEMKKSKDTNTHAVNSQTPSNPVLSNYAATNIQPLNEAIRDFKAPLSPATVTKPWTATRASPLPEPRWTCTPTLPRCSQTPVPVNQTTETKPSSVIKKDKTNPPIVPLQNNPPTSTVQPSAKSLTENKSKPDIKSPTTKDTSVPEVKVHSQTQQVKNTASNSIKEGKLSPLQIETSASIHSTDPVLTSKPTLKAKPPTKQVASRPSSATVETKPSVVKTESPPNLVQISLHTSNVQPSTEPPVQSISPAKPATDTVMKPSIVKAAVIDSATPASLPQASVSVKAPSPNRGTSPPSQQKVGLKDKDVLKTKTTSALTEAPAAEPSTKSATSTASSTADKTVIVSFVMLYLFLFF